jgi:hypothetical protein
MSDPAQSLGRATCLLCDAPLAYLRRVLKERFCGDRCRWAYEALQPYQVCGICGRPLSPREYGDRVCLAVECRRELEERNRERERLRREALRGRAGELRDRVAPGLGLREPATYRPAVIPSFRGRVTNLPERRRRAFRDSVNRLISDAGVPPKAPPPDGAVLPVVAPTPEVQAVLGRACALCRGSCCRNGGNRAYLTVETILRYRAGHPDQRPRDVLAAYLSHVGNKTYDGSCIFHGPGGCGLPREMRSDTCNRFFCTGLTEFQQALTDQDPPRGFFVTTDGDTTLAAAFCDAEGARPVPLPPAGGEAL